MHLQAEGWSVEGKIWPRASALAERLWTDTVASGKEPTWIKAENRFLYQRDR